MQSTLTRTEQQRDLSSRILQEAGRYSRLSNRDEILRLLAESEQAAVDRVAYEAEIARLEAEQDSLVEKHQADAQAIQTQLMQPGLSFEDRLSLRESLATMNRSLQENCDSLNRKIAATQTSRDESFLIETRIGALKQSLAALATVDQSAQLEAAEQFLQMMHGTSRQIHKKISELRGQLAAGESRYNAGDLEEIGRNLKVSEAVASFIGDGMNSARATQARIRKELGL